MPETPSPRTLSDLPYARHLTPLGRELSAGERQDLDCVRLDGGDYQGLDAPALKVTESALTGVAFSGGRFRRARFNDVWMHTVRFVGTDLAETSWLDTELVAGVLAGLEMHGSALHRVVFHQCKLDSVNLRAATLREVVFADCLLRDTDFAGARLTGVSFPGSSLEGGRFAGARMKDVDLRSAAGLDIADGVESLRGATIGTLQLFDLAPRFAHALGVDVRDD
ncbi:pentapeptide repeat-containing protein [Streptomyces qinzhouensis]|uniref:Pentapeptide repeat-containing protein n=1 Tax=Streptomyces qinzhouensis TaxID=2599401 RepID=A0A5B8IBE7_9ACTN|nr:pentapeptide repeat-containing protein [Streptomyces qinzhouensis]QDY75368.1 pentapeptide repeat-containing protein [Streptomyces qinzhouensis]